MKRENIRAGINTKKMSKLTKKIRMKVTDFNEKFDHGIFKRLF